MVATVRGFAGDERRDQGARGADKDTEEGGAETNNGEAIALSANFTQRWHPQKGQDRNTEETLEYSDGDLDKDIGPADGAHNAADDEGQHHRPHDVFPHKDCAAHIATHLNNRMKRDRNNWWKDCSKGDHHEQPARGSGGDADKGCEGGEKGQAPEHPDIDVGHAPKTCFHNSLLLLRFWVHGALELARR